jgi:hypothetical protein
MKGRDCVRTSSTRMAASTAVLLDWPALSDSAAALHAAIMVDLYCGSLAAECMPAPT